MKKADVTVNEFYGNRVRLRVCGICIVQNKILLVNHSLYDSASSFWSPPGGGVQFGETAIDALKREFKEETGLNVEIGDMLFMNEFIQPPLHAVEIFFNVVSVEGELITGSDPEFLQHNQIIKEVRFLSIEEVKGIAKTDIHGILKNIDSFADIFTIKGYISNI